MNKGENFIYSCKYQVLTNRNEKVNLKIYTLVAFG